MGEEILDYDLHIMSMSDSESVFSDASHSMDECDGLILSDASRTESDSSEIADDVFQSKPPSRKTSRKKSLKGLKHKLKKLKLSSK